MQLHIAHISDMHLTQDAKFREKIVSRLLSHLKKQVEVHGKPFDYIVISGDIIDSPCFRKKHNRNFLEACKRNIDTLAQVVKNRDSRRIRVAVGNHDTKWSGIFGFQRLMMFNTNQALAAFTEVFKDHLGHIAFDDDRIVFASFNTNALGGAIQGATGLLDIYDFSKFGNWIDEQDGEVKSYRRVAIIHHHPMPVSKSEIQSALPVDQTDYLRLRNSGTIVKHLLSLNFDLTLHGHLHDAEHWSINSSFESARTHPIEIISAGSVGKKSSTGSYSFNCITLHSDGPISAGCYSYGDEGGVCEQRPLLTQNYEELRNFLFINSLNAHGAACMCKLSSVRVNITPRTGNVLKEVLHVGVKSRLDQHQNPHPYFSVDTITHSVAGVPKVTAYSPRDKESLRVRLIEDKFDPESQRSISRHAIELQKMNFLRSEQDFEYSVDCSGAAWGSQMHMSWHDKEAAKSKVDGFSHRVNLREDMLTIDISFLDSCVENVPSNFQIRVYDMQGDRVYAEESSQSVVLMHHSPWRAHERLQRPDITLHVTKPIVGYEYRIEWEVPIKLHDDDAGQLSRVILKPNRPYGNKSTDTPRYVSEFLSKCVKSLMEQSKLGGGQDEANIEGYLYGFNTKDATANMAESYLAPEKQPGLPSTIRWGYSVVGEVFRYRRSVVFAWNSEDPNATIVGNSKMRTKDIPTSVRCLYAIPLYEQKPFQMPFVPHIKRHLPRMPYACLVLATRSEDNDVMRYLLEADEKRIDEYLARLYNHTQELLKLITPN